MTKDKAVIKSGGQGGFLNPPTHPEHNWHVSSVKRDDFSIALSSAVKAEYIVDNVRQRAKEMLDEWEQNKPALDSDIVQDWIHQVLGYFRNCYSKDGIDRKVNECLINKGNPFNIGIMRHLGVLYILQYYPEYEPKGIDFMNAYWGKKPEESDYKEDLTYLEVTYDAGTKWKRDDKVHVIASTTPMMVIYYDEKDESINPKLYKDTKLAFQLTHKEI